jgi:hypothetical protein
MSDGSSHTAKLRERLTSGTEDKLGKALVDLFENPLITGTIGRAFDARERAAQAQELALSALNIPTAADIERLTRRLRSVSQRLEGIEDGVHRINRALTEGSVEQRLAAMEEQLKVLGGKLAATSKSSAEAAPTPARRTPAKTKTPATAKHSATAKAPTTAKASAAAKASMAAKASSAAKAAKASQAPAAAKPAPKRAARARKSA